ncbi:MAG: hypothetical protein R3C14_46010 [Caldilineaceae bacterium]
MQKISLTGIKPTGDPHVGNYLGMIQPALALVEEYRAFYFIADYHALTVLHDPRQLQKLVYELAATWRRWGLTRSRCSSIASRTFPKFRNLPGC